MDVSTGGLSPAQKIPLAPGYQVPFSEKVKKETGITTMTVGLIAGAQQAEDIVASGKADMVALARGALWDPRWAWHAAEELGAETPYAPKMMACHPKLGRSCSRSGRRRRADDRAGASDAVPDPGRVSGEARQRSLAGTRRD